MLVNIQTHKHTCYTSQCYWTIVMYRPMSVCVTKIYILQIAAAQTPDDRCGGDSSLAASPSRGVGARHQQASYDVAPDEYSN